MKMVLIAAALTMSSLAHAGSPPTTTCTNAGGTINYKFEGVTVLTTTIPEAKYESFRYADLEVSSKAVGTEVKESRGCTSREVSFKQISFKLKSGKEMPDAYNHLAQDGVLTDYFVCTKNYAWMPAPGQSCK